MKINFVIGTAYLSPNRLGELTGRAFAELAVETRMRGLRPEVWCEFMNRRTAALSKQFDTQEQADVWAKALIGAYQHAMDHDCECMMMQATAKIQADRPN